MGKNGKIHYIMVVFNSYVKLPKGRAAQLFWKGRSNPFKLTWIEKFSLPCVFFARRVSYVFRVQPKKGHFCTILSTTLYTLRHPETPWDTLSPQCVSLAFLLLSSYFHPLHHAPVRHLHGYRWRTLDPPPNSLATGWTCRAKPRNFKVTAKHSEA